MGAHVWGPAFLRDHLLPNFQLIGLEHGLVRRHAGLPLLHGRPGAGDRRPRHDPALRRGVQARRRLRARHAAVLLLGVRPAGPLPLPDARAVRLRRAVLRPRRELQHLRRQPQVDDGRRVLVLDRPQPDDPRLRPARRRHADRASTAAGRPSCWRSPSCATASSPSTSRVGGARHRARQHRRMRSASGTASRVGVGVVAAVGVLGRAVPRQPRVHDRHEVRRPARRAPTTRSGTCSSRSPRRSTSSSRRSPSIGFVACVARRHAQRHGARRHRAAHRRRSSTSPRTACRSSGCCGTRACCRCSTSCATC